MSLVAWYTLNGNLKDIGPNGLDLKLNVSKFDEGILGKCFILDNTTSNSVNNGCDIIIPKLVGKRKMSITCWLKQSAGSGAFGDYLSFGVKRNDSNTLYYFRLEGNGSNHTDPRFYGNEILTDDIGIVCVDNPPPLETWIHVAFVFDETGGDAYLNGKHQKRTNYNWEDYEKATFTGAFQLSGSHNNNNNNILDSRLLNGAISNIKIYDHCLSKEEVKQDYLTPMLHYAFEDPYVEPTENLCNTFTKTPRAGVTFGTDSIGDYFIKPIYDSSAGTNDPGFWNGGVQIGPNTVYGGNYYTWSLEVMPTVDLTAENNTGDAQGYSKGKIYFDRNISTLTWSGNDYGCKVIDTYLGNLPKNVWTKVWLTVYIDPAAGKAQLLHDFCPISKESELKIYFRNGMLEKKDHMTPYTETSRTARKIRDNSGMGNDGTIEYERIEIPIEDNDQMVTKQPDGSYIISSFSGQVNQTFNLGTIEFDSNRFYLGSVTSFEFDIKLENIKITNNQTFAGFFSGMTYFNDGSYELCNSPVRTPTNITTRLKNATNGTYHICAENKVTDSKGVTNVDHYALLLRFDYIQSGKITVSNLHCYYDDLDTSSLGIVKESAMGQYSAHFNGKSRIDFGNGFSTQLTEMTMNLWGYSEDWGNLKTTPIGTSLIDLGGGTDLGISSDGITPRVNGSGSTWTIDESIMKSGWHMITLVISMDTHQGKFYINGKQYNTIGIDESYNIISIYDDDHYHQDLIPMCIGSSLGSISFDDYNNQIFHYYNIDEMNIDDVKIYPIALSEDDIKTLYNIKAKIDNDGNIYCNQLIETKKENMFINGSDPTLIDDSHLTKYYTNGIFSRKGGVLTYTVTSVQTSDVCGFYINNSNYGGSLKDLHSGKKFRYSCYIKVSSSGKYHIGEENIGGIFKWFDAGKWYYVENKEGYANRNNVNFVFYKRYNESENSPRLKVGETLSIRDLHMYRIDDDLLPIETSVVPKITKKSELKGFELKEVNIERYTDYKLVTKQGVKWLLVFHHNTHNNTEWFKDEEEALHCNSKYKYSILDELEYFRGSDGKFEFLLEYPEIPNQYNRWKQTDNPTKVVEQGGTTATFANGYEAIHIDWSNNFGGLLKDVRGRAFLNGSMTTRNWYYTIGCYNNSTTDWWNALPGQWQYSDLPGYTSKNPAHEVNLYVRLDDDTIGSNIIEKDEAIWAEVFYHNTNNNTVWFKDTQEALHTNSQYKFSVLDHLEEFRREDDKFEFLLEYPDDLPEQYVRWKQSSNPIKDNTTTESAYQKDVYVEGYELVHDDWNTDSRWSGLLLNQKGYSLLDGIIGENWWYSIGSLISYTDGSGTGIPGPIIGSVGKTVKSVRLYCRIDNLNNRYKIFKLLKTGIIKTKEIKEI